MSSHFGHTCEAGFGEGCSDAGYDRPVVTVCLPGQQGLSLVDPLPPGVRRCSWDGSTPAPEGIDRTSSSRRHDMPLDAVFRGDATAAGRAGAQCGIDYLLGVVPERVTSATVAVYTADPGAEWVLTRSSPACVNFLASPCPGAREWTQHVTGELAGSAFDRRRRRPGRSDRAAASAFDAEPVFVARVMHARGCTAQTSCRSCSRPPMHRRAGRAVHRRDAPHGRRGVPGGMRDGALLVNAARGPVVVTEALLVELESAACTPRST